MEMAFLRFFESLPAALAVGLLLLPRLIDEDGARFTYEHMGFTGIGGFLLAKLVLGPVRKKMLDVGLPAVLADIDSVT